MKLEISGEMRECEPLSAHTYLKIGGPADVLVTPKGLEDLQKLFEEIKRQKLPWLILGLGSNVLVSDQGVRGVVIKTTKLNLGMEFLDGIPGQIRVGASVPVFSLLNLMAQKGYEGLEFLAGVPGSMGGVITMNAGTYLGEIKDVVMEVRAFDTAALALKTYTKSDLKFSYRKNHFLKSTDIVWDATLKIQKTDSKQALQKIKDILDKRKKSQPVEFPSCGSVFKNPEGQHAWQVVDRLGLRGYQVGKAQVSELHSNFIINLGGAKALDVKAIIDLIKTRAKQELKVEMEEEVKYVGF